MGAGGQSEVPMEMEDARENEPLQSTGVVTMGRRQIGRRDGRD